MEHVLVLNGISGLGAGGTLMSVTAGNTEIVPRVATFSLPQNPYVSAQKVGSDLQLVGLKAGTTALAYQTLTGDQITLTINVTGLSTPQAAALVSNTWDKIKTVLGEPALAFDWQDAGVLAANFEAIRRTLVTLRNAADTWGSTGAEYEAATLIKILDYAKRNPDKVTLLECVIGAIPTAKREASLSRTGRECRPGRDGANFGPLYAFAKDYGTAMDVLEVGAIVTAAVAAVVATVVTLGGAGAAIGAAVAVAAAAAAAGAKEIPKFVADPDKLARSFGDAVCAAINNGALPARLRAPQLLRRQVLRAYTPFALMKAVYDNPRTSAAEKTRLAALIATHVRAAQTALAQLQTLDQPQFFAANTPLEDANFKAAAAAFRSLDVMRPVGTAAAPTAPAARPPAARPPAAAAAAGGAANVVLAGSAVVAALLVWRAVRG